jgi:hypothetical protein
VSSVAPAQVEESLPVSCDAAPLDVTEVLIPGQGRVHRADPRPGTVTVAYAATVRGAANTAVVTDADRVTYLRPSRYAESDRLAPIAQAEFLGTNGGGCVWPSGVAQPVSSPRPRPPAARPPRTSRWPHLSRYPDIVSAAPSLTICRMASTCSVANLTVAFNGDHGCR